MRENNSNKVKSKSWKGHSETVSHLRVDDLVSAQRAGLPESFTAHLTYEGPGPRVHRHVSGKIVMRIKNLQTTQRHTKYE